MRWVQWITGKLMIIKYIFLSFCLQCLPALRRLKAETILVEWSWINNISEGSTSQTIISNLNWFNSLRFNLIRFFRFSKGIKMESINNIRQTCALYLLPWCPHMHYLSVSFDNFKGRFPFPVTNWRSTAHYNKTINYDVVEGVVAFVVVDKL